MGTYDIEPILEWVNENKDQWCTLKVKDFLAYVQLDTWGESPDLLSSNLKHLLSDEKEKERVLQAKLECPIVVTNDNEIVDGVHRLFKSIQEGKENILGIFIDRSFLNQFQISSKKKLPQTGLDLPIPDLYLRVPKSQLPSDKNERREIIESYFSDQLPSVTEEEDTWLICLERPQERYGCYMHDENLKEGLQWWKEAMQVHDIPLEKRILKNGLLSIEDQWIPYSWSLYFKKLGKIPSEIVLLHLDDHQDMMVPRIGKRLDGKLFDYITGNSLSLDIPSTIEAAILSGAIGKGSILMPLIWSVEKIHVRHLAFRSHPNTHYHIKKQTIPDGLLSKNDNRISIKLEPTNEENLQKSSNYVVTPDIEEWLKDIPKDIPILLHIDMDYFNDRFDGNSSWKKENRRVHEVNVKDQLKQIEQIFIALKDKNIVERIVDTSIGISPGFYPAEFWPITVSKVLEISKKIGIVLE
jgi:hypothetical protein